MKAIRWKRRAGDHSSNIDLHDDGLIAISVLSPKRRNSSASIDLELSDDSDGKTKHLRFVGCANIRLIMDFDVLGANWFAQTHSLTCIEDLVKKRVFVQTQRSHWHTKYVEGQDTPIQRKLASIESYRLFRITFFGGTMEVLARKLQIRA